ncbi:OmpA family protein [Stenotrophomonas sp. SORGH_AS_0321]|uniref:OmpA family protein n=1 Tax=Stenotrophomonas sp. SORGH_AS_0321 TaxID=3041787 RepID=UPI00285D7BE0|nr:OmpA family protein [Stenotrophomonas sp. SORGH_AS_0321]MDR6094589.1 OOP family OmpA-OmpF porin [Stenotrophomonas sp. SORGH_AS_0321]
MDTTITHERALRAVLLPALLACLTLAGCRSHGAAGEAPLASSSAGEAVSFPEPGKASLKEGVFADPADLRRFAPGMSKRQLYALLGTPHFNEGMWGVREWNYLFNFRTPQRGEYFTCQFQVRFDGKGIAQGGYWKPQSCAALVEPPPPPRAELPAALPREPLRLAADALFAFDSDELSAAGHRAVDAVLGQVQRASEVQRIEVVGYTDRIGSASYNQALSQRRAEAVRRALVDGGVAAEAIRAEGRGDAEPLVQCDQRSQPVLIACLAPNRRVQISGRARVD